MNKDYVLKEYFENKVDSKSLRGFKQKTPQGNFVSGWICLQPGEYFSSILLTEIQIKDKIISCNRFLRGMPKQHYFDKNHWSLREQDNFNLYSCYEKIDGTCLMTYALYDEEDNLIEIVPRTRGMAVAANHIVDMFRLIDQAQIEKFYSFPHNYDYVLMFELYGILNRHEITYHQYYIDIRLIGASIDNEIVNKHELISIAFNNDFMLPDLLFELYSYDNIWSINPVRSRLFPYYIDEDVFKKKYDSIEECINALTEIIEDINNNYKERNSHVAVEGVVINGFDEFGTQRYVKLKPKSILKMARMGNGIPSYAIRKEVYKYFDEYGIIKIKNIYNEDKHHFLRFVQKQLLEEFDKKYVTNSKTVKKITNIFFTVWEKNTPDLNIQEICQELAEKYSDKDISDIMRIFSKEYPSMKNKSKTVYSILKHLVR